MDVPQGTAAEVLAWVGDDPERAEEALNAEHMQITPRTTLIAKLETIASKEAPVSEETTTVEPEAPEATPPPPCRRQAKTSSSTSRTRRPIVGPANVATPETDKPDDSYDLAGRRR